MKKEARRNINLFIPLILIITLSACTPHINLQKPLLLGAFPEVIPPRETQSFVHAILEVSVIYRVEVYPHLDQLYKNGTGHPEKMSEPVSKGLRGVDAWYLAIKRAEKELESLKQIHMEAPKVREIASTGETLIRELKLCVRLIAETLQDSDAYSRSWEEKNLSQLNQKNEDSLNRSIDNAVATGKRAIMAYERFAAVLN